MASINTRSSVVSDISYSSVRTEFACVLVYDRKKETRQRRTLVKKLNSLNIYIFGLKQRHKENLLKRLETYAAGISETLDETVTHVVTAIKVPSEFLQEVDKRYNVDHDHADTNAFSSKQFFKSVGKIFYTMAHLHLYA